MVQPLPLLFALLLVGVDAILHLRGQDEGKQCMKEDLQHRISFHGSPPVAALHIWPRFLEGHASLKATAVARVVLRTLSFVDRMWGLIYMFYFGWGC